MLSNPHFMRQVYAMISEQPLSRRDHAPSMMYCALRVLKLPHEVRKEMVMKWDDVERMGMMRDWLWSRRECLVEEVLDMQVPGRYNSGIHWLM